ncbi:unnamed protein product [Linum tenue]|uniref:(S)-hydroxynitrile lyase n=1 Tax=Linum tenue TaxID=586396 RepID=A0AAV0RBQ4_9ROSI|nr:unnamed protein product [Linum tenue]
MKSHFVLVHGTGHGAWCWYKLVTLLESAGHKATALDLGGSGIDPRRLDEVNSITDYVSPLVGFLAGLPEEEKVILVGHSYGGIAISLAMEKFPGKVLVGVFVTALMPNSTSPPANVVLEFFNRTPAEALMDSQVRFADGPDSPPTSAIFGPRHMATSLYQESPPQDLELAKAMVRPSSLYLHDLSKTEKFTEEGYGSVRRVFVICNEDRAIKEEYQRWMIENYVVERVMEIKESDHMAMLCEPTKLFDCLSEIADNYS